MTKRVSRENSSPEKGEYKWIVGPLIVVLMAALAAAGTYGATTALAGSTADDVVELEVKVDTHITDNKEKHEALEKRLNGQDVSMVRQETILLRVEKKLDDLGKDVKEHLQGNH